MGLRVWLLSRGIVGAVARNVIRMNVLISKRLPNEKKSVIMKTIFDFWLVKNEDAIRSEDSEKKVARLDIIMGRFQNSSLQEFIWDGMMLHDIFLDILYIETGVNERDDPSTIKAALKVFKHEAIRNGIDVTNDFEIRDRIMG